MLPIYNQIGDGYDGTRKADPYLVDRLAAHLKIEKDKTYLDLACGTGNYTVALEANYGGNWIGLDVSERMIEEAKIKNPVINWQVADCSNLPFISSRFNGAICTLAIHHFPSLDLSFKEIFRVLDNGRFVILTTTPEQMQYYWLCEYFPKALKASIDQMPSLEVVAEALQAAGLNILYTEPYDIQESLQDCFLYSGKHRPAMYLDPKIRAGISTFAAIANHAEVESGCEKLASDIQSGRIEKIQSDYFHKGGDYLFIIAHKA